MVHWLPATTRTFIYDMYHSEKQSADGCFLILVVPFTSAVGLWGCIYLKSSACQSTVDDRTFKS